jgi:hypothetical protein
LKSRQTGQSSACQICKQEGEKKQQVEIRRVNRQSAGKEAKKQAGLWKRKPPGSIATEYTNMDAGAAGT